MKKNNDLAKKQRKKIFVKIFDSLLENWIKQLEEKRKLEEFKQTCDWVGEPQKEY